MNDGEERNRASQVRWMEEGRQNPEFYAFTDAAVVKGDADTARQYLDQHPDWVNATVPGGPALCKAAYRGFADVVRLLVERGADINARDTDGDTPLGNAVMAAHERKGSWEVADLIVAHGGRADTGMEDFFQLHLGMMNAPWQTVRDEAEKNLRAQQEAGAPCPNVPPPPPPPRAESKGTGARRGPCFIATACYGSYDHPDVLVFRRFRDGQLLQHPLGRSVVSAYYAISPAVAGWLERNRRMRLLMLRVVLEPLARLLGGKRGRLG